MVQRPSFVGQRLGNYRLTTLLGKGGFAEVYLGEHIHLGTQAAVKVLTTELTPNMIEQFRNEARAISSLEHPHIVHLLEYSLDGSMPYIVMDYAANGSLRKQHQYGTCVPLQTVIKYVKQVAAALQYAHDKGLVHRDVKPDNMLIGKHNEILLSDFGVVTVSSTLNSNQSQELIGTWTYIAPEQIQRKPVRASDQYALGVTVYEWLCGRPPFEGDLPNLYHQHLKVSPQPLRERVPDLPHNVEQVVMKALAKEPHQRFATVQAFATALEQASQTTQSAHRFTPSPPEPFQSELPLPSTVSAPSSTLSQMLSEMDQALVDELEKQQRFRQVKHRAVDGKLVTEENGRYIYQFTLLEPWEPKDNDARLVLVNEAGQEIRCEVGTANGIEITIVSESALPSNFLRQVDLCEDSTELLRRLREALKKVDEGSAKLGSKSFGFLDAVIGNEPSTVCFGNITPHNNQLRAAKMALAGEVTYIVGPPGTGKTVTLAAIALDLLLAERTVLIVANTNIAVDNAIMKLCELCKQTQGYKLLSQGKVIRYGTVQKQELKTDAEYEDVYVPKIARKMNAEADQQRKTLEQNIAQIDKNLSSLRQPFQQREQEYQERALEVDSVLEVVNQELVPLEQSEKQRVSKINADKERYIRLRQEEKRKQVEAGHLIAQYSVQIEAVQKKFTLEKQKEKDAYDKLIEAHSMSKIRQFFKGIRLQQCETNFAEVSHNVRELEQKYSDLQRDLQDVQKKYDDSKQEERRLQASLQELEDQLAMPTVQQKRIAQLKEQKQAYQSRRSSLDTSYAKEMKEDKQQQKMPNEQRAQYTQQLAIVNQKLRDMEKNIVENAIVVGTTLSKAYMNQTIADRRFDVVILDEVSMASLPSVYVVTSHADRAVVLIGDPQQLAPIARAETKLAENWLKKDLFVYRGISLDIAIQRYMHSIMLNVQSRMHPMISAIANRLVYQNKLKDAHNISQSQNIEPLPAFPLVLCDTHDASPIAMRPPNGSRKNYYHALCCLAIARKTLKSLFTQRSSSGPCIGIVTPYAAQARLLQSLIADAGLQNQLQAGTVHKFQGLEFEIVIFDTVESPGVKPSDFTAGSEGSESMRLVNVAITRAKQKLIVVANYHYILQEMPASATIRRAVEAAANSARLSSLNIINFASTSSEGPATFPHTRHNTFHSLTTAIDTKKRSSDYAEIRHLTAISSEDSATFPHTRQKTFHSLTTAIDTKRRSSDYVDIKHLTDENFYASLHQDIQNAQSSIVIASAFAASNRLNKLLPYLDEKQRNGIEVKIFSRGDGNEWHIKGVKTIRESGFEIINREKMHEKIIVIDEKILYHGSLNALSQKDSTESMLRIVNHRIVQEVNEYIQSDRTFTNEGRKVFNLDQATLESLEKITLSVKKLPPCPGVCNCGGSFVQRYSAKNGSAFYGCSLFPSSPSMKHTIISLSRTSLGEIRELQDQLCTVCGNSMSLNLQDRPQRVLLVCNNDSCGRMKRVMFTK